MDIKWHGKDTMRCNGDIDEMAVGIAPNADGVIFTETQNTT